MATDRIEIGVLFSRSGSYNLLGETCRAGALSGIAAANADPAIPFTLVPVERDPQGNVDCYGPLCAEIFRTSGARHVVGCVTSWSRKEVIPELEKAGGVLWYPCPYEGFESSEHVIYAGACPNQHLVPLLDWALPRFGARGYLVGSNYIWGWEIGRVARDLIVEADGEVVGDRCVPIGDVAIERTIAEIRAVGPSFVLNSLIGPSSYAFIEAYAALGAEDRRFLPGACPILSCNLTEAELPAIGPAADGVISVGPYFREAGAEPGFGSSFEAAAHQAVLSLAALLAADPSPTGGDLAALPAGGGLSINPATRHATLPVLIAQARGGAFRVLERTGPVAADPWLSRRRRIAFRRPALTVAL